MRSVIEKISVCVLSLGIVTQSYAAAYPVAASVEGGSQLPMSTPTAEDAGAASGNLPLADNQRSLTTRTLDLPKSAITMDFVDADIRDVLHLLALKSGLNIIYGADVTGPITIHLDRVPFDQAFQTVLTLKSLVALPTGSRILRVVTSTALAAEQTQATTFTRVFRLNYALAADVKVPIDAIRASAGRKGVSSVDSKSNSLIVTDTIEGLQQVEELIPSLDRKPQQVDIEAKIIEVQLDNGLSYGVTWGFARKGGPDQFGGAHTSIGSNDLSGNQTGPNTQLTPQLPGSAAFNPIGVSLAGGDPTRVAFSYLHSEGAYLLNTQISALATQGRVKILSTPHIVTLNNEEAKINVTNQDPYRVSTTNNNTTTISYQFVESGVKLSVKPTINADRRITLKIHPEVSNSATNSIDPTGPPIINSRNADTMVVLKDGETMAIGGLITEKVTKSVSGVPLLMNIPILGYFFKNNIDSKSRNELIVFLTPKIAAE